MRHCLAEFLLGRALEWSLAEVCLINVHLSSLHIIL